jgi:hypothetical protein
MPCIIPAEVHGVVERQVCGNCHCSRSRYHLQDLHEIDQLRMFDRVWYVPLERRLGGGAPETVEGYEVRMGDDGTGEHAVRVLRRP